MITLELRYTLIRSSRSLGKKMTLQPDGKLMKTPLGEMTEGTFELKKAASIEEFAEDLKKCTHLEAFSYCVFEAGERGRIVTKAKKADNPGAVARCKDDMGWSSTGGILFLDYDPADPANPLSRDALVAAIRAACPFLEKVKMLWRPSASSLIRNETTGEELRGIAGQRLYIAVDKAGEIPRIGKAIYQYLWIAGHGRYEISGCGATLPRTIVDLSVWDIARLDFTGGSVCETPLSQGALDPVVIPGEFEYLSCSDVKPLSVADQKRLKISFDEAQTEDVIQRASRTKQAWIETRARAMVKPDAMPPGEEYEKALETARIAVTNAVDRKVLYADFQLVTDKARVVTVGEILDDPKKWHGARFADPLEPEYHGGELLAKANLYTGGRPYIRSFAHGGQVYHLERATKTLKIEKGAKTVVTDAVVDILRESGDLFDAGDSVLRLVDNEMVQVNPEWLEYRISREISFQRFDTRTEKYKPSDCPNWLARSILGLRGERGFRVVKAVATAPTMTTSGRIIDTDGYDDETGLLLRLDADPPVVPRGPTPEEVRRAASKLWEPFALFPFVDATARGVMFAALLTAAVRPCLPIAPAFAFDAPTAGSGKTLLAKCVSILANGKEPALYPPFDDEAEARKKITAALMAQRGAIIIDNVNGTFENAVFAQVITAKEYRDRILSQSAEVTLCNRALWMLTGNNFRPVGELNRRILLCRINPAVEASQVYRREFRVDPANYCMRHRQTMIAAALTIIRGFIAAGSPRSGLVPLGTFEEWSKLVMFPVTWLGAMGYADVSDPSMVLDQQVENDPEQAKLHALFTAWYAAFAGQPQSVSRLCKRARQGDEIGDALNEAIGDITGEQADANKRRMLGRWIEARKGKIVSGFHFAEHDSKTDGVRWWKVQKVGAMGQNGLNRNAEEKNAMGVNGVNGFYPPSYLRREKLSDDKNIYGEKIPPENPFDPLQPTSENQPSPVAPASDDDCTVF